MSISFELKPINNAMWGNGVSSVDEIAWSVSTDKLPLALEEGNSGVSLSEWKATCAEIQACYASYLDETTGPWNRFVIHYSAMTVVMIPMHVLKKNGVQKGWEQRMTTLVQEQSQLYEKHCIQVSAIKEMTSGRGHYAHYAREECVGLRFDILPSSE